MHATLAGSSFQLAAAKARATKKIDTIGRDYALRSAIINIDDVVTADGRFKYLDVYFSIRCGYHTSSSSFTSPFKFVHAVGRAQSCRVIHARARDGFTIAYSTSARIHTRARQTRITLANSSRARRKVVHKYIRKRLLETRAITRTVVKSAANTPGRYRNHTRT